MSGPTELPGGGTVAERSTTDHLGHGMAGSSLSGRGWSSDVWATGYWG